MELHMGNLAKPVDFSLVSIGGGGTPWYRKKVSYLLGSSGYTLIYDPIHRVHP